RLHHDAERWGIATQSNGLDYATLLHDSCAQVVVGPGPTYTGNEPGDQGSVEVGVGSSIDHGPVGTDVNIEVESTIPGSGHEFSATATAGQYSMVVPWPSGLDPLRINISATVLLPN